MDFKLKLNLTLPSIKRILVLLFFYNHYSRPKEVIASRILHCIFTVYYVLSYEALELTGEGLLTPIYRYADVIIILPSISLPT